MADRVARLAAQLPREGEVKKKSRSSFCFVLFRLHPRVTVETVPFRQIKKT